MVGGQVEGQVVTEMRKHASDVKTRRPFPGVLLLARSRLRKDAASHLGQSRRTDHNRTPVIIQSASITIFNTAVIGTHP